MNLSKYKEINILENLIEIEQLIVILQKKLFILRINKTISKNIKSHFFNHIKRQIAQLNFKKYSLIKLKKNE